MELLFWLSLGFISYTYLGYPLLLWLQSRLGIEPLCKTPITPAISVVISAFNEEKRIGSRLDNLLAQEYPSDLLEIIVVSDGSTDLTGEVVRSYCNSNVRLLELRDRKGKAAALNVGIAEARGEIIFFADVRQRYESDAIVQTVANFSSPLVGCVSGELLFLESGDSSIRAEMGVYWNYEKWIRRMESVTGSVVGATGAIYAIRKDLYRNLAAGTLIDDVMTPLNVVMQGYRCVFDGSAVAYDTVSKDASLEWKRKVRTLAGNWQLLSIAPRLFVPVLNPLWWRFMSHKIFRLIVPFALIAAFCGSLLSQGACYRFFLLAQILAYALAAMRWLVPWMNGSRFASFSFFFVLMNMAALAGLWRWLTGRCTDAWDVSSTRP